MHAPMESLVFAEHSANVSSLGVQYQLSIEKLAKCSRTPEDALVTPSATRSSGPKTGGGTAYSRLNMKHTCDTSAGQFKFELLYAENADSPCSIRRPD